MVILYKPRDVIPKKPSLANKGLKIPASDSYRNAGMTLLRVLMRYQIQQLKIYYQMLPPAVGGLSMTISKGLAKPTYTGTCKQYPQPHAP